MSELIVSRVEPEEITFELTAELQRIALLGWRASMPERSVDELRTRFNPQDRKHIGETRQSYLDIARESSGGLMIAYDTARPASACDPVGYILAKNDVSGTPIERLTKRLFRPGKVYAHLQHVCVAEPGRGIGSRLVAEALGSFRPEQIPTAYIFDENTIALETFRRWGFNADPAAQDAHIIEDYFHGGKPVQQKRYAASSVRDVISTIEGQ